MSGMDCGSCQEMLQQCDINNFFVATCTGQQTYIPNFVIAIIIFFTIVGFFALIAIIANTKKEKANRKEMKEIEQWLRKREKEAGKK